MDEIQQRENEKANFDREISPVSYRGATSPFSENSLTPIKENFARCRINKNSQKLELLEKWKGLSIPISYFLYHELSSLEIICTYLKEECKLKFNEIAFLMNRDDRTVWGAYANSKKKSISENKKIWKEDKDDVEIPVELFRNRDFSVLEIVVGFLKDAMNMKFCQIARRISRDDRTVWTIYHRLKKKEKKFNAIN